MNKYQFVFSLKAESFDDASNTAARILIDNPEVEGFRLDSAPIRVEHKRSDFPTDSYDGDRTAADHADAPANNYEQGFED